MQCSAPAALPAALSGHALGLGFGMEGTGLGFSLPSQQTTTGPMQHQLPPPPPGMAGSLPGAQPPSLPSSLSWTQPFSMSGSMAQPVGLPAGAQAAGLPRSGAQLGHGLPSGPTGLQSVGLPRSLGQAGPGSISPLLPQARGPASMALLPTLSQQLGGIFNSPMLLGSPLKGGAGRDLDPDLWYAECGGMPLQDFFGDGLLMGLDDESIF
mmetsp:Transcript_19606/g.42549  ORF Transcript_19606/g.42549 Transcript_19606/m.42549 type:complete len:210 (-) Transcript_19606:506-1135(-)